MIKIAVIDQNQTFRESLKTLLEQIPEFKVTIHSGDKTECLNGESTEILLLDDSIGENRCRAIIEESLSRNKLLKIIILTLDYLSPDPGYGGAPVMLKNSGKKEFEYRIRTLLADNLQIDQTN